MDHLLFSQQDDGRIGRVPSKHELGSSAPLVLFSAVGVDVEERVDAFEQSRFNFVRRAVNDM